MAESERILDVTDDTFGSEIEGSEGLALVDFWAVWCGPCRFVAPIIEELANEHENVKFAKMDVDQNPSVPSRFAVRSIPTVIFFKDGEPIDQIVGAAPKPVFEAKIAQHAGAVAGGASQQA